jgi:hypothetical protein
MKPSTATDGGEVVGSAMSRLAATIRHKLSTGALPARNPVQVRLGYGRGQPCTACEHPIPPSEPEYEFDAGKAPPVRFHLECYGLWDAERRRRGSRPRTASE